MLKLTIEESLTGPLAHLPTRRAIQELADRSNTLEEAFAGIETITGLACYKGGSHVAIHSVINGGLSYTRWGIITQEEP